MDRFTLLAPMVPEPLRRRAARRVGRRGDLELFTEMVRLVGAEELAWAAAREWPEEGRPGLCTRLAALPGAGWRVLERLLALEDWRVAMACSLLDYVPPPSLLERVLRQHTPRTPSARALLLFACGRAAELDELDFDRSFLRQAVAGLTGAPKLKLLHRLAQQGLAELVAPAEPLAWHEMGDEEFGLRLEPLLCQGGLARALPAMRLDQAARAIRRLLELGVPGQDPVDRAAWERWRSMNVPDPDRIRTALDRPAVLREVDALWLSPTGSRAFSRHPEGFAVLDLTGGAVWPLSDPGGTSRVVFSKDGCRLALVRNRTVSLWAPGASETPLYREEPVSAVAFSERRLYTAGVSGGMGLLKHVDEAGVQSEPIWYPPVEVACMTVLGPRVAMGLSTGELLFWAGPTWPLPHTPDCRHTHQGPVAFLLTLNQVTFASVSGRVAALWDAPLHEVARTHVLEAPARISAAACEGRFLALGLENGQGLVWDHEAWRQANLDGWGSPIASVAVAGTRTYLGDASGSLRGWDPLTGACRELWAGPEGIRQIVPTPSGVWALAGERATLLSERETWGRLPVSQLSRMPARMPVADFLEQLVLELHRFDISVDAVSGAPGGSFDIGLE
ncbi:MAG: hypothetical protein AB1758_08935 [Candidatus Eremiobacterota bacterium]